MTDPMTKNLAKDEWFSSDIAGTEAQAWYEWMLANSVSASQDHDIVEYGNAEATYIAIMEEMYGSK